ncbi:MAG: hypothetical protein J6Y91_06500 [Alphaproteobacteria bacterium]|nr:hypothetical protein [Alphaproteobacteria bacterium]
MNAVAENCHIKDVTMLNNMSQQELVDKIILPHLAGIARDNIRYNRITGTYMQFLADWGQTCIELDRTSGELLMEMALQRLSKGAVIHSGVHLINILPDEYKKYTAAYDEPGLVGPECWNFIKANLVFCIQNLRTESYRCHAEAILWGLLDHLNPDGSTNDGYMWNRPDYVGASEAEAYHWAEVAAIKCFGVDAIAQHFAPKWQQHKDFLRRYDDGINWDNFFKKVDLDAEPYSSGLGRFVYKLFGAYDGHVRKAILKEIHMDA